MNILALENFLSCYSLPTVIIALIVTVVCLLLNFFFKEKMPKKLQTYLPAIIAIALQFAYDCIFVFNKFYFSEKTFYAGIMSSSLSTVFSVAITKLINGESVKNEPIKLLIEGIIQGYVTAKSLSKVVDLVAGFFIDETEEQTIISNVAKTILRYREKERKEDEIEELSKHLVKSVKSLKE